MTPEEVLMLGKTIIAIERLGAQTVTLTFSDGTSCILRASHYRPDRMTWLAIAPVEPETADVA
jgi:hypothetical protein